MSLPVDQAFQLWDLYIIKLESLSNISGVTTLFMDALMNFTAQANAFLILLRHVPTRDTNQIVQKCMDYAQKHTHTPLTVQGIATAPRYHRSYLSTDFSKAIGIHFHDYIYQCKPEAS